MRLLDLSLICSGKKDENINTKKDPRKINEKIMISAFHIMLELISIELNVVYSGMTRLIAAIKNNNVMESRIRSTNMLTNAVVLLISSVSDI